MGAHKRGTVHRTSGTPPRPLDRRRADAAKPVVPTGTPPMPVKLRPPPPSSRVGAPPTPRLFPAGVRDLLEVRPEDPIGVRLPTICRRARRVVRRTRSHRGQSVHGTALSCAWPNALLGPAQPGNRPLAGGASPPGLLRQGRRAGHEMGRNAKFRPVHSVRIKIPFPFPS
jgi:hypothetical protein